MNSLITKHASLTALSCPTLSWYERNHPTNSLTPGEELRLLEGQQVGELARAQFPTGVLVDDKDPGAAAKRTTALMADPKVSILFEAAFIVEPFVTRADVLLRTKIGWTLIEVKSALHKEDEIHTDHIDDMAYTTMVLQMAGISLSGIELMRLSDDWTGKVGEPFKRIDASSLVFERATTFSDISPSLAATIFSPKRPEPKLHTACKDCDYFANECWGKGLEYPIVEIPRISEKKLLELSALNVKDIREIPLDFKLTPAQDEMVETLRSGKMQVDKTKLSKQLLKLSWPCYYLDFETAISALPLWEGIPPFEQVLTQYSLHICNDISGEPLHREYLAPTSHDARRELAERLIHDLGSEGSILVYSSFEKTQINALAKLFPDLATKLLFLCERLFDLEVVFKEAISHPGFRGRTSIKVTLPTLVPELSYNDLLIGRGDAAVAAFVRMVRGWCSDEEAEQLRAGLLAYCKRDTLAMVRLHRVVAGLAA